MQLTKSDRSPHLYTRQNVSQAASIDNVRISGVSNAEGMMEMREVTQRQVLSIQLGSSTTE